MKKTLSLILALAMMLCAVSTAVYSAEEAVPFTILKQENNSISVTGDSVSGYTASISGTGRSLLVSDEAVPIDTLMFEYGYKYSDDTFGQFGVALKKEAVALNSNVNENILVFHYRASGGNVLIYLPDATGSESGRMIGEFGSSDRRGDAFWDPNISSFGFVKAEDGHWYLSIDGLLCNATDYSALDTIIGSSIFEQHGKVYPFFGGYNSGTAYYKRSSEVTSDNGIALIANDSYGYYFTDGKTHEWRGQGLTNNESTRIERYAFPKYVAGNKTDGYEIDFTGTAGFAQTTEGFDLKTTTFKISAVTYDGNTAPLYYDFGFTTDPTAEKHHDAKTGKTVEFRATSVFGDNYTLLHQVIDGSYPTPSYSTEDRTFFWKTTRYEANKDEYTFIDFVQDENDGHWYMRGFVGGTYAINKTVNFDSIIDKPVYFRFGANQKSDDSFKMLLQVVKKDEEGNFTSAWSEESSMPIISASQEKAVNTVLESLILLDYDCSEENIKDNIDAAVALKNAYALLTDDAKAYLQDDIEDIQTVLDFLEEYEVKGDLNGDYKADITDLQLVKSNWLNAGEYKTDYDFNSDGVIDIEDAVYYLLTYIK